MRMNETLKGEFLRLGMIVVLFVGCSVKYPTADGNVSPMLSDLRVPDMIYLQSDVGYPVSVRVADPQGWEDIASVRMILTLAGNIIPVLEDTLKDDGLGGDIIPRDGVFWGNLAVAFAGGAAGKYIIEVRAEDFSNHLSEALSDTFEVVDGEKNFPPILSNPVIPDTLTAQTSTNVFLSIQATDPQGLNDIHSVFFEIFPPWAPVHSLQHFLRDDGGDGDTAGGDSIFSFRGDLSGILKMGGKHTIRFQAVDGSGLTSKPAVESFVFFTINDPPILSNLIAPDTVSRSAAQPFLLAVRADDPQGLEDVQSVVFYTTKPDGTPSGGNPFRMFDDGSFGDVQPGDGVYSLTITITAQNNLGIYKFDFIVRDHSGAVSDTLSHFITVVD